jgi:peptidoglycan/LPS O-acetylase OafA/YrhL
VIEPKFGFRANLLSNDRILQIDGLRGVAVLLVVLFHYFSSFGGLNGVLAAWPPFNGGIAGVLLFFIVSGFVIGASLEGARSILAFATRRLDRLFLPMAVISTTVLLLLMGPLHVVGENLGWSSLLPSWTFSLPRFWRWVDPNVRYVDGSYWTLFYEVRFYTIAAIVSLCVRKGLLLRGVALAAILESAAAWLINVSGQPVLAGYLHMVTGGDYLPFFGAGCVYLLIFERRANLFDLLILAVLIAFTLTLTYAEEADRLTTTLYVATSHALFIFVAMRSRLSGWLAWRPLVWVGKCSYSLYLLHGALGFAVISRIPKEWPLEWQAISIVLLIVAMLLASRISYKFLEKKRPFSSAFNLSRPVSQA